LPQAVICTVSEPITLRCGQCLVNIPEDIVEILQANREAHHLPAKRREGANRALQPSGEQHCRVVLCVDVEGPFPECEICRLNDAVECLRRILDQ
jgi:hypothetical protein